MKFSKSRAQRSELQTFKRKQNKTLKVIDGLAIGMVRLFQTATPGISLPLNVSKIRFYIDTIRHLKFSQLAWRIYYKARKPRLRAGVCPATRHVEGIWTPALTKSESWLGGLRFRFLNMDYELSDAGNWNEPNLPKLWLYNLNYFDWLASDTAMANAARHNEIMQLWRVNNPFGHGNGWEPYPISLRVVNWIKFALAHGALSRDLIESLATQIDFLAQRVEYDLLANHLIANAKCLIFGGWFFEGREADKWAAEGLDLLVRELDEQVLADGAHCERSPMYHSIILEDLLDLVNLAHALNKDIPPTWTAAINRMRRWLQAMTHADGAISLFNDAAFDIAATPSDLETYARRLEFSAIPSIGSGLLHLAASGYFRWQCGSALLLGSIGDIGPSYQPGHSHAETFSFEWSHGPNRLIVNSGTSTYAIGQERERQRSTGAHNTVVLDGQNSSEVWASFRVAHRARVRDVFVAEDGSSISAAHDGYRRLDGHPIHHREWRLTENNLTIIDSLSGGRHTVDIVFHFHPAVQIVLEGTRLTGSIGDTVFQAELAGELTWDIEPSNWHPRFGEYLGNIKLVGRTVIDFPQVFTTEFKMNAAA